MLLRGKSLWRSGRRRLDERASALQAQSDELLLTLIRTAALEDAEQDLSQRREAAVEAFEVEVDGRGEPFGGSAEAAVEAGRQELALAQDELAAARVSLEQEFEAKSADVESREAAAREQIAQAEVVSRKSVTWPRNDLVLRRCDVASVLSWSKTVLRLTWPKMIFLSGGLRWRLLRLRLMVVVSGCGFWRSRLLSSGPWRLVGRSAGRSGLSLEHRNLCWRRMSWLLLG